MWNKGVWERAKVIMNGVEMDISLENLTIEMSSANQKAITEESFVSESAEFPITNADKIKGVD